MKTTPLDSPGRQVMPSARRRPGIACALHQARGAVWGLGVYSGGAESQLAEACPGFRERSVL